MSLRPRIFAPAFLALAASLACAQFSAPTATTTSPAATPGRQPVERTADEPYVITGSIPFTSPFFLDGIAEPFVLLEDEFGFVDRDKEFVFPLEGQAIGPVELVEDGLLRYTLPLPARPLGTLADVDNDGEADTGVMVFAIAYWSNTWGDAFLEPRDGRGWSNAYTSARTDPYREDEIDGGTLLIWAPDDEQSFPSDFGPDEMLFTADDPSAAVPAGYSLVDLDASPFRVYREPEPKIDLLEGVVAVTDLSGEEYASAFEALFEKASREYPFTDDKDVDWEGLHETFAPRFNAASDYADYYRALKDFTLSIPDGHIGVAFDADVFFTDLGGSLGMVLAELSDGRVIVQDVLEETSEGERTPAAEAGILAGAEILEWDGNPVGQALDAVVPFIGPHSTAHGKRLMQLVFLTRYPVDTPVAVLYRNPGGAPQDADLTTIVDYDSLFAAFPEFGYDELALPVEAYVLDDSGLGYIRITTFSEDYNLMARLWEYHLNRLVDAGVPGLIIDVRNNGGGNGSLALDFAGYFFDESFVLSQRLYFNETSGTFEPVGVPTKLEPGPFQFDGPVAVLVGPNCASACEGFAHAMIQGGRAIVIGHTPSAGMYGEVGRGQYEMPGDLSLQFPTGRPETPDGDLLIEGVGIVPDIKVPITYDSVMGTADAVLEAAIDALLARLG
jgi:C-terminal processing protease CtpA/Prc